jgi:3-hydroxyacyl-CoA dehydrogenase/enoyl-CoA hydratase/3-hydroxybutyryl-CoA epimerase
MDAGTASVSPSLEIDGSGIGWIVFDDPERKLNVLSEPVMLRFAQVLDSIEEAVADGRVRTVVIRSGKPDSFMAGADVDGIAALENPFEAEEKVLLGQAIYNRLEQLPVPTVAAIHGVCVGGGLEMALACRHRILSDSPKTRVGLPEVMLGILPSWGGTTRLPRLVGLRAALDLLLTGDQISAARARRIGLADEVLPAAVFQDCIRDFAVAPPAHSPEASRTRRTLITRVLDNTSAGRRLVLAMARRKVMARTGGHYPAPQRILDVLRDHLGGSVEESLAAEARVAGELIVSSVCKNLIHVFRLREAARRGTGVDDDAVDARPVHSLAILGAGVMGGGIAQLAAYREMTVRLRDVRHDALAGGLRHARSLFDKAVNRRKLTRREADQRMDLISGGLDYTGFRAADFVVEAVVERIDVKQDVLGEVEEQVREDCILATNTSALSVDEMAEALERPDRFCGLHFFNPVHKMPLVEVVRGSRTSDETVATAYRLAVSMGKVPVVVADGPGFLVNRILAPYLNEAGHLLGDGASVEEIDGAARAFGMPMGPLRLIDEVGVDVSVHAGQAFHKALGERLAPAPALARLADSGRLGKKGSSGFYTYQGGRQKGVDPSIYATLGLEEPTKRGPLDEVEIRRRLVVQMINEAARVLEEGTVGSASAVDLALIMGTGFPPFRGGLLRFADSLHPRAVLERVRVLEEERGERFAPPAILKELARDDRAFYEVFGG